MAADYRYAAGIIDADGWISLKKNVYKDKPTQYFLEVGVKNLSKDLIDWLYNNYKGSTRLRDMSKTETQRDIYVWQLRCNKAAKFLKRVIPYLIVKKERAFVAVKFQKTIKYFGRNGTPEETVDERERLFCIMKKLNKRGRL